MQPDDNARDHAIATIAFRLLALGSNRLPSEDDRDQMAQNIFGALAPIPTEHLEAMLDAAAAAAAPHTPKVGDMLGAWKKHQASASRVTFQEEQEMALAHGEPSNIFKGPLYGEHVGATRAAHLLQLARHAKGEGMVYCHCPKSSPQKQIWYHTATLNADKTAWVCAGHDRYEHTRNAYEPSCDFGQRLSRGEREFIRDADASRPAPRSLADIKREAAIKAALTESEGVKSSGSSAFDVWAERLRLDLTPATPDQLVQYRAFQEWWIGRKLPYDVSGAQFGDYWQEWQAEVAAAAFFDGEFEIGAAELEAAGL